MNTMIELTCNNCSKIFYRKLKNYNVQLKRKHIGIFCSINCRYEFKSVSSEIEKNCPNCDTIFTTKSGGSYHENIYCSITCANRGKIILLGVEEIQKRTNCMNTPDVIKRRTDKIKQRFKDDPSYSEKLSKKSKENQQNPKYVEKVLIGIKNSSEHGKKVWSSKGENEIRQYFRKNFPNDNQSHGGPIKHQNELIVRDLFSDVLKVCIEYDGPWHFKNINGQLETKRKKDIILENWCIKNEYRLIRIDDDLYRSDKEHQLQTLYYLAYNNSEEIIKIGKKYSQ